MDCRVKPGNDEMVDKCRLRRADNRSFHRYIHRARHVRAFGVGLDVKAMTGSRLSSDGLDARRKRLLFRCWHRGTKELDLIIGGFADAHLPTLTEAELDQLEKIIEAPEPELYAALTGEIPAPQGVSGDVFEKMKSFRVVDGLR
jgi:antitoxin CptB